MTGGIRVPSEWLQCRRAHLEVSLGAGVALGERSRSRCASDERIESDDTGEP
jgi:hypothetical protein